MNLLNLMRVKHFHIFCIEYKVGHTDQQKATLQSKAESKIDFCVRGASCIATHKNEQWPAKFCRNFIDMTATES